MASRATLRVFCGLMLDSIPMLAYEITSFKKLSSWGEGSVGYFLLRKREDPSLDA